MEWLRENTEAQNGIREVFVAAWQKVVTGYRSDLIEKTAQRMASAFVE